MKIRLSDILVSENTLTTLVNAELPVVAAYKVSKLLKLVQVELKEFYEARDNAIKKYGKESESNKGDWSISPDDKESIEKFNQEMTQLAEEEIELVGFSPIPLSLLGADLKLTPAEMSTIDVFLKEE